MINDLMKDLPDPFYHRVPVNPLTYKGYRHPAWPPERSLDFDSYFDPVDFVQMDLEECQAARPGSGDWKKNVTTLMMIYSSPTRHGRRLRDNCRKTWIQDAKQLPGIKVVFVLGQVMDEDAQRELELEQTAHCDLLQFRFMDDYFNTSLKSSMMIQYFYRAKWDPERGPPEFMYKGDDDTFVDIINLDKHLHGYPKYINFFYLHSIEGCGSIKYL